MRRTSLLAIAALSSLSVLVACSKKEEVSAGGDPAANPPAAKSAAPVVSVVPLKAPPPVAPPAPNPAEVQSIHACCAAVHAEISKEPAKKADWELAAKTCDSLADRVSKGTSTLSGAISALRAAAQKAGPLPAACK